MIDTEGSYSDIGLRTSYQAQAEQGNRNKLGQEEFLDLMVAQLRNQDPLKPMENGDFITQMAQFSAVTGLDELNKSFDELSTSLVSSQSLQAASLVGREVLAPTGIGILPEGGGLKGSLDLPTSSPQVTVKIYDAAGQLVRDMPLGSQASGAIPFQWDGLMDNGQYAPAGRYVVTAEASIDGSSEALEANIVNQVEAVTLGAAGLLLQLKGAGEIRFSDVQQIL
ncbi:flagellar hook assembly protein FlgD [Thiohalobacter sp. IOR34]|uniref:flagellar hook assembly protein FlgD n=1 Tax=Thiohalobacter sp. IOR34 TaxID=3057176 RepID=UPI0025B176F9|nr:flagellar hook assembly protein FlgD [Thiohalobacter sp. IOR34]WJW74612.1 flagellar hook assembly protein FlgD [Thiohalobacter sp. IOR34]